MKVGYGTVVNLLKELGIRKLCSRFVPYFLSGEMCERRVQCCRENLELHSRLGDNLLRNIVTEDETPLSLYLPEDRRTSAEFKFPGESAARKLRSGTTHRRALMLTVFWDISGIVDLDFVDRSTTLNSDYYVARVESARKKRRKSPRQQLYLLHDNSPIHTSNTAQTAIGKSGFIQLSHPPYSPDLAPSDYYLFRHLKQHLRGRHFVTKDELATTVNNYFQLQTAEFYEKAFLDLVRRWTKCVDQAGSYIEKH